MTLTMNERNRFGRLVATLRQSIADVAALRMGATLPHNSYSLEPERVYQGCIRRDIGYAIWQVLHDEGRVIGAITILAYIDEQDMWFNPEGVVRHYRGQHHD